MRSEGAKTALLWLANGGGANGGGANGGGFGDNVVVVTMKKRLTLLLLTTLLYTVKNDGTQQASPARKLHIRRG